MNQSLEGGDKSEAQVLNNAFSKIFKDVFSQHGFVYNQISSYDNFLSQDGIHNILQNMFKIHNFMAVNNNPRIKSIKIEVSFENSQIEEQRLMDEAIYDTSVSENKINGMNYPRTQDINLPVNCRNYLRTLKVNVYSDINIKLTSYSGEQGTGAEVATKHQLLKKILVVDIPLMMGSKYCSLSKKSIEERIRLQEDPLDLGGYFIIKGVEWSLDFTESYKFNELYIKNIIKNKTVEGFILSKNGDGFELSFQVTIIYQYKTSRITARLEKYERIMYVDIPFYVIFKLFGITNQVEMTEMIIQDDVNSQTELSITLKKIIQQATNAEYEVFEQALQWKTQHDACSELSQILNREEYKKQPVDKYLVYDAERIKDTFYELFLPHLGQTAISNTNKMRYFGMQIRKVLMAHLTGEVADLNTYLDKRVHATGQNLSKQFKKTFNHMVIGTLKKKLFQELENVSDVTRVDVGQIIQAQLSNHTQQKNLQKAITTGSGSEMPKAGTITLKSSIQSQKLIRKNELNSICQMRLINNKKQSLDKQSKEILKQRSVQPSFTGFICIVQSAANGEKAGKLKSLSSLSIITNATSSKTIISKIWEIMEPYEIMYDLDTFASKYVAEYSLQSVYVNGFWIGFVQNSDVQRAAAILRNYRRNNHHEWKYLTVYINEDMDLYIYSDYGRILVPLVIVHYDKQGNPYHKLDPDNIKRIMSGKGTIDWYLENQILEYVSVEEAHNYLVAESAYDYLTRSSSERSKANRYRFTHIMIPQSLLGIAALLSPFMNHAQTKRITMFTNQAKQSCGWAMYNYPYRMDKGTIIQQYISQPLVKTIIHDFFPPDGTSLMVAYTVYDGQNQEDSVIVNSGSVDQGLFNGMYYNYYETQIKGQEDITPISFTQPPNKRGNYTKLQNGIVQIGTWVEKNDVLVAKKQPQRQNEPEHDTSLLYKEEEPGCVEDVHIVQDEQNVINIRVKIRTLRNLKQGDKMSSGQGCKAVISQFLPVHEMPYTDDQQVPDIIFNPHSIPTRMMIGQMIEASYQRICAQMCDTVDGTAFSGTSVDSIRQLMEEYQIEDHGYKYLYNGETGERIKAKIFLVPTFYYRLQKFAITQKYVVDNANIDILSRQPLQNRKDMGGSRLGEMEKDTLFSSGTSSIFAEKFYEHSDSFNIKACKKCGMLAEFNPNPNYSVYQCSKCKDNAEIVNVQSSWGSLLFQQTIKSMQLDMKLNFNEPEIEQYI